MIEIRTGSDSDIKKMDQCYEFLDDHSIEYTRRILSAHRTPEAMAHDAKTLSYEGFRASISAAGGSAHLPGMTASETLVPVVGLPIIGSHFSGLDSFLSIVQMPDGIPVGTVGAGQAQAAAELATRIAYIDNLEVRNKLRTRMSLKPRTKDLGSGCFAGITLVVGEGVSSQQSRLILDFAKSLDIKISTFSVERREVTIVCEKLGYGQDLADSISRKTETPVISLYFSDPQVSSSRTTAHWIDKMHSTSPVALMGLDRYKNAVLYAAQIQALYDLEMFKILENYRRGMKSDVIQKNIKLTNDGGLK